MPPQSAHFLRPLVNILGVKCILNEIGVLKLIIVKNNQFHS